tara:strand:- start:406 stop:537 length:132 start_codon:yes stop_codon:yes gene_type:complete
VNPWRVEKEADLAAPLYDVNALEKRPNNFRKYCRNLGKTTLKL